MRMLAFMLLLATSCVAQTTQPIVAPATQPTSQPAPAGNDGISTDDILDAMHDVGVNMKSLRANIALHETDVQSGDDNLRTGTIVLERRGPGDTRAHVNFVQLDVNGKQRFHERIEYLLDGDWVIDRNYGRAPGDPAGQRETHRQVRKPGDKTDLLKLGEGPFPLPIGQPRQSVRDEFEVSRLPDDPKKPELIGVELRPKPTTRLSERFETITVWVDPKTGLPNVIETIDPNQSQMRVTTLSDVQLNAGVGNGDFVLDPVDAKVWTITTVPLGN